jgi:hypothetical protein
MSSANRQIRTPNGSVRRRTREVGSTDPLVRTVGFGVHTGAMPRRKANPLAGLAGLAVIAMLCCGGGLAVYNSVDTSGADADPGPVIEAPVGDRDDAVDEPDAPAANEPETVVDEEPADEPAEDAYYKNCAEARAAGAAPLHRGDPGYRAGLDRDDDGTACESG